jgi:hypothetical protein
MSKYNGNVGSSASISFPAFSELIEEYCDRNPKERSKYLCPACGAGNLSVNKKTGAFNCHNDPSPEHRQEITTALNNSYKAEHPELSSGKNSGMVYESKPKTERQVYAAKGKAAQVAAVVAVSEVEMKVEELTSQLDPSTKRGTVASLQVEMAAWAKAHGHDVFSATRLLAESLKRVATDIVNPLSESTEGLDRDGLAEAIRAVLDQNLTNGQLSIAKSQVRKEFGIQPAEFSEIWKAISEEFEITPEDAEDRGEQISKLLDSQKSILKAAEIISPGIAAAISELAQWHNMREEVYMSMYMAAIGSCAKNGAVLNANIFTRFRVTPNLYTLLVAESSQKKSPVMTTMVGDPLKEARTRYARTVSHKIHGGEHLNSGDPMP